MSSPSRDPGQPFAARSSLNSAEPSRIFGHGEMADLIRNFPWHQTSLGSIASWPDTLVTTVNMLLASRHPMFLWWGPELIQFYNDGYRPSIRADKHPRAVGQRGTECWPEIWHIIGPQIQSVMTAGHSSWNLNQLVPINRDGKLEEVYWTYGYSPIRNEHGVIQGTLVACTETTDQVLTERRLKTLVAITASSPSEPRTPHSPTLASFAQDILSTLDAASADIPFALLYQLTSAQPLLLAATSAARPPIDSLCLPLLDSCTRPHAHAAPLAIKLPQPLDHFVCAPWPESLTHAYVLPLRMPGSSVQAVLLCGLSPRLPFDQSYETFLQLVGSRIAGLLQTEIQRSELFRATIRFKALAAADPFGMMIGNLQGELKYINPGFLETLGYSEHDVAAGNVRWDDLTPPEYRHADALAVQQLRETGRCKVYEKAYLAKDGRRIPILIGAAIIDSPHGEPEVAAYVTELSPLKLAEEALRKANDDLERKVTERTAALESEVAERQRMELSLRELTGRLLSTQDEERRHMARELHDNAGQTLAALSMNLSAIVLQAGGAHTSLGSLASEARQLSDDLSREIRTLSYLLHPPLLDEVGLESAIRWFVEGFSERSKIHVALELPEDADRLPRPLELVIFRVVQESLTNVHRHSGSSSATIRLTRSENTVRVEITDCGKGLTFEKQRGLTGPRSGVGVRGMEERVRQFGGTLQISSNSSGTTVVVTLPLHLDPAP